MTHPFCSHFYPFVWVFQVTLYPFCNYNTIFFRGQGKNLYGKLTENLNRPVFCAGSFSSLAGNQTEQKTRQNFRQNRKSLRGNLPRRLNLCILRFQSRLSRS
ncbi:hypothetical protein CLOM621_06829 [Clostridium sp. M62/1]|nr:hypothetical protein CLOM621_06829 [Clostridium sp. M62/1]